MRQAQREILNCHALAKELTVQEDRARCHAIAQACSVVHTQGHAMGFPIYDLTAIVLHYGLEDCRMQVEKRVAAYEETLARWQRATPDPFRPWAAFFAADTALTAENR